MTMVLAAADSTDSCPIASWLRGLPFALTALDSDESQLPSHTHHLFRV
jgi:hypothetical protein